MTNNLKIIILGRVLQILITLLSMRLLTTILTPDEVGNYYLLLGLLAFFNLVLLNPPGMYFSRHLLEWQRSHNLLNALGVFMLWMLVVASVALGISLFIYGYFDYENKFDLGMFLFFIIGSILISTIHRNVMFGSNTLGFRKKFVQYLLLTLFLGLLFSVLISYVVYPHALGWLMGVLLSESLTVYAIFRFFIQDNHWNWGKIKKAFTQERLKKIFLFTFPIGITTFLMWGQTIAYRFLVDSYYSAEVLSFIAVGLGIAASVFGSVESIVMQYYNPVFLKEILDSDKKERAKAWNNIAKQVVPVYIMTLVFTLSLAEPLTAILVDSKFHSAYVYVVIGAVLEFFRVMSNLLNNVAQSEYKTGATVTPYLVGFTLSMGILSSVDFGHNYLAIAEVLAVAYLAVYIVMYFNMRAILEIKYEVPWTRVLFLSLPFGMIDTLNISQSSIWVHLGILGFFGLYYLGALWLLLRKNLQKAG